MFIASSMFQNFITGNNMKLPLSVTVEVEGGVVQNVGIVDADGETVDFVLNICDYDEYEDDEESNLPVPG